MTEQLITVTAFGTYSDRHIIHYFYNGQKRIKHLDINHEWAEGFINGKISQYDAIEVAAKFEDERIASESMTSITGAIDRLIATH